MKRKSKILLVHTGGIGDLIMARPAIQSLRRNNRTARIDFLGNPRSLQVLAQDNSISRCIPFPSSQKSIGSALRVFAKLVELRLSRYNGLYLLQPVLNRESYFRLRLLVLFAGAGESFGRHNDFGPNFVSVAVPEHNGGHEVERMLSVVQRGASPHVAKEAFVLPSDFCDSPETGRYARGSYAVLSPGGTKKFRRWPIENFIALSHRFRSVGLDTVFVGEEAERDILHGKETQLPDRAENVIGCTSLRDLSSIVSSAKIVVANDSGPMHLANALDVPVVGIFGSGDAVRTRPFLSEKARIVDSGPLGCKPCYAPDCKAAVCMEEITLDRVWKAAEDLME